MSPDKPRGGMRPEPDPADDIEILEVIGLDEDGKEPPSADPDDVEVVFEDAGDATALDAPAAPSGEEAALRERLLRLQADFENFKKRMERERVDHVRYATADLVRRILPVLDNFERAMAAARHGGAGDALLEGVALIQRQLLSELELEGLRRMDGVGEPFDPVRHEAVATDPDSPMPPHTVTQVFQRGYFLRDRVLRPAMVRVRIETHDEGAAPDDGKES
ncbi:MAG TPA: nucleotide exchange factor GrpE [Candidatus Polarisedimenticolaceae bacterium]|nr:nucleotide exchange factor GrpE [Candidatus Polarisedimenticolaceae bacterium]